MNFYHLREMYVCFTLEMEWMVSLSLSRANDIQRNMNKFTNANVWPCSVTSNGIIHDHILRRSCPWMSKEVIDVWVHCHLWSIQRQRHIYTLIRVFCHLNEQRLTRYALWIRNHTWSDVNRTFVAFFFTFTGSSHHNALFWTLQPANSLKPDIPRHKTKY